MPIYKAGDVVLCRFPLAEDPLKWTTRLALVLKVIPNPAGSGAPIFVIAKITTTDLRERYPGRWVEKFSKEGMKMHLDYDSFIRVSDPATVPLTAFIRLIGNCDFMDEIEDLCTQNNITF